MGGLRHGKSVKHCHLVLHADVAVGVGGGAADDGDINRNGRIKEIFLAVDVHQAYEVFFGAFVQLAALFAAGL